MDDFIWGEGGIWPVISRLSLMSMMLILVASSSSFRIHLCHFYMFLQVVLSVLPCKSMLQSMSNHPDLLHNGVFYIHLILVLCSPCEWLCPAPRLQSCGQQLTIGEVFIVLYSCSMSLPFYDAFYSSMLNSSLYTE